MLLHEDLLLELSEVSLQLSSNTDGVPSLACLETIRHSVPGNHEFLSSEQPFEVLSGLTQYAPSL